MKPTIEIIENNAGGLTIQNTETGAVASFDHKSYAADSLRSVLAGDDMTGWDLSDPAEYITDEQYQEHAPNGGLRLWDEAEAREFVGA